LIKDSTFHGDNSCHITPSICLIISILTQKAKLNVKEETQNVEKCCKNDYKQKVWPQSDAKQPKCVTKFSQKEK